MIAVVVLVLVVGLITLVVARLERDDDAKAWDDLADHDRWSRTRP